MSVKPKAARDRIPAPEIPALLEASTIVACFALDGDFRLLAANALGREWLGGRTGLSIAGIGLETWLTEAADRALIREGGPFGRREVRVTIRFASGERVPVVGDLVPAGLPSRFDGLIATFREDGGRAKLLAGIERSARLEALGSLTSGVAHDFNNLLTILVGNLALVAEDLRDSPKLFVKIKTARDAARRGGELIGQLLRFARQQPAPAALIEPGRVIAGIAPLIERALGSRIRLEIDIEAGLEPINGNAAQLESVVVNLAINARDAIDGEGTVRIGVGRANRRGAKAGAPDGEGAGPARTRTGETDAEPELCIEVADDGSGISPDLIARIFEPFFTTKPEGRGSGLGLSMVKAYTDGFGGRTELVSEPGAGTAIRLLFPGRRGRIEDSAAMTMPVASLPSGDERILLDLAEEGLSAMLQQILSVLGYRCQSEPGIEQVDLVISDRAEIPGTGIQPAPAQRADGTRLPRLLLRPVGDDDAAVAAAVAGYTVLHKPFSLPDLAAAVRRALDGSVA